LKKQVDQVNRLMYQKVCLSRSLPPFLTRRLIVRVQSRHFSRLLPDPAKALTPKSPCGQ
jgi:hypothetical protein